jgi:hypothetical protein
VSATGTPQTTATPEATTTRNRLPVQTNHFIHTHIQKKQRNMAIFSFSTRFLLVAFIVATVLLETCSVADAFAPLSTRAGGLVSTTTPSISASSASSLNVIGKKKPKEDLSFIESRDMTREEMLELNKKNEDIMNMELQAMTGFSLVLSLPILYLCWVAFFSD